MFILDQRLIKWLIALFKEFIFLLIFQVCLSVVLEFILCPSPIFLNLMLFFSYIRLSFSGNGGGIPVVCLLDHH